MIALAIALQVANTSCYGMAGSLNCTTTTVPQVAGPDYGAFARSQADSQRAMQQTLLQAAQLRAARQQRDILMQQAQAVPDRASRQAEGDRVDAEMRSEALARAKKAGRMAAEGDCEGARKYALNEGDFDLAGKVAGACAPSPGR